MSLSHIRSLLPAPSRGTARGALLLLLALGAALLPAATAPAAPACPNQAVREQQGSSYLPNCRAYELASPVNKNEQEVEVPTQFVHELSFRAAATTAAVTFTLTGGIPGSLSGGLYSEALASSAAPGSAWQTHPQNPQNALGTLPAETENAGEFHYYSPELSCGVESTILAQTAHAGESTPLIAQAGETPEEDIDNLYLWDAADDSLALITSIKPSNPVIEQRGGYSVDGASQACARVIYENGAPGYNLAGDPENTLYEWSRLTGLPRVASVLASGKTAEVLYPTASGSTGSNIGQISRDGSRVFFSANSDGAGPGEGAEAGAREIYARINGSATIAVSRSHTAVPDNGALFQAASEDGRFVFFRANYGLTAASSPSLSAGERCETASGAGEGAGHCDLYRYDLDSGSLIDLSPDEVPADHSRGANVRGVLGVAADGSAVYFSASGQLVPGRGNSEEANEATSGMTPSGIAKTGTEANIYEYRNGALSYVASIGEEEAGAGGVPESQVDALAGGEGHGYQFLVARVSSDASRLLLATRKQLTSYDNRQQGMETREWEQYEYSSQTGSLSCVSCDPGGARPIVNPAVQQAFGPLGLFVQARQAIPRALTDDGRVFFDSFDPLSAQATNKNINAYEWYPPGVAGCETGAGCVALLDSGTDPFPSYFEDASANGANAYVTTHAQLAPQDQDGLRDIYDVRVDGGALPAPAPAPCSGETCQGPLAPTAGGARHASESAPGGNLPAPGPGASGEAGVKSSVARRLAGGRVSVSVTAPGRGVISITGHGVRGRRLSVAGPGVYRVGVSLTGAERRLLKRRHQVTLTVRVSFLSASGRSSVASTRVRFR